MGFHPAPLASIRLRDSPRRAAGEARARARRGRVRGASWTRPDGDSPAYSVAFTLSPGPLLQDQSVQG